MNHQTGTQAKRPERKLGSWPTLQAHGSLQLGGAMRAGPDVGGEIGRAAGGSLSAGQRKKEQTDGINQLTKCCHPGKQGPLATQGRNPVHQEGAQRPLGGGDPSDEQRLVRTRREHGLSGWGSSR